ncbi:unnamed protein product [Urochloa decumbens]|uniref:C2 tensin-type domain-containing protein n=1 Tax=Urochloa decumbens TaxID=240449 RepID=A0ABC9DT34_9POAL
MNQRTVLLCSGLVLQRSHARARNDPLNKPNVQTTTKTSKKTNPPARLPLYLATTGCHPLVRLPQRAPLLLVTSPPSSPARPHPPPPHGAATRRRVAFFAGPCGGGGAGGGGARGRMALFRRLFYRRPPEGLVEISGNILVFDHCFSTDLFEEDELMPYIGGILKQLLGRYSIDSFMVFNFEGGKKDNQIANIFSYYDMSVMGYPRNYEGCPLLTMEMIHHFLRSSESWLTLSQDNFLLIHSEHGGWPVLSFALAALLVYLKRCSNERKALEMVCKHAPDGLAELFSPIDPVPSQLRYLKYVSKKHTSPELWPPVDRMLNLNCIIIRKVPNFDGQGGCRPIFRIYGLDPLAPDDRATKVLFSTPKTSDFVQLYTQEECEIIKVNVHCPVQGDIVIECISLDEDFEHEVMVFRAMFSTAFIEDNLLVLDRDQIDILWDTKHRFPVDFRVEAIFSEMDMSTTIRKSELSSEEKESLSKVDDAFSHLDWSSKTDTTNHESDQCRFIIQNQHILLSQRIATTMLLMRILYQKQKLPDQTLKEVNLSRIPQHRMS